MQKSNCIQDNQALKAAFTSLYYNDSITAEESETLYNQIREYLSTTPPSQLVEVHYIIRERYLMMPKDALLADLVVEVGVAQAENAAYMNGVAYGDEPYFQPYDDYDECFDYSNWSLMESSILMRK